jgi:hypothetical protein
MPRKVDDDLFIEDGEIDYQESEYFDDVKSPTSPATKKKVAHDDDDLGEEEFAEEEKEEE